MGVALSTVAALAFAPLASAQEPKPDEGVLVSEVIVRPLTPGPAWWRVSAPSCPPRSSSRC